MGESEGFGSSGRGDSEDSCFPKRKCISLNIDRSDHLNVPLQVISLSKISTTERRNLEVRLRTELQQIQVLHKKILARAIEVVAVSSSTNGQKVKKRTASCPTAPQVKSGAVTKPGTTKCVPAPLTASSSSYAVLMKQCEALLKRLMQHQYGWVFNTPVDVVKLNIPDYFSIIKQPMDLGTIKCKVASGAYMSPWGFLADVRLTFSNAMTYNPPGNDVHLMADTLSQYFEVRWKSIEKKLVAHDSIITREKVDVKPAQPAKKRKVPSTDVSGAPPTVDNSLKKMVDEERHNLARRLDALIADLPTHIIDFLKKHSNNGNQTGEDEIEIDMDALADDTVFELKNLLDEYLHDKKHAQQTKNRSIEVEQVLNISGLSSYSLQPCKVNDPVEEDIDIGGIDPPVPRYPPIEIEKDIVGRNNKCSSSSSSSSESRSSSSGSDSAGSSGSESEAEKASSPTKAVKGVLDQEKSDIMNPAEGNCIHDRLDQPEQNGLSLTTPFADSSCQQGENAPSGRQVSPEKLYRAALLRNKFADTILKAREKALDKTDKSDPDKVRLEREELERLQREEKARLQAEARAAEEAHKQAQAEAVAEAKHKRELEREAARQALLQMEKTVEINENSQFLEDLEMLRRDPVEQLPSSVDETSPDLSQDGLGSFRLRGSNPLEQLGLFMKADEEDEEDMAPNDVPSKDVEDGEID